MKYSHFKDPVNARAASYKSKGIIIKINIRQVGEIFIGVAKIRDKELLCEDDSKEKSFKGLSDMLIKEL